MGYCRWTVERFAQGWDPNPIAQSLKFPEVVIPPVIVTYSFLIDDVANFLIDDEAINLRAKD